MRRRLVPTVGGQIATLPGGRIVKREHVWSFAFVLVAAIAGCGTSPNTPQRSIPYEPPAQAKTHYRLPPGASVALADARSERNITSGGALNGDRVDGSESEAKSRAQRGLEVAAKAPVGCLTHEGVLLYPLCVVTFGTMGLVLAPVFAVGEAIGDAAIDDATRKITSSETRLTLTRYLLARVQSYTRESGISDVPERPNTAPLVAGDTAGKGLQVNYVFEVVVTKIELIPWYDKFHFYVSAEGSLVRTSDNAVVDSFTSVEMT